MIIEKILKLKNNKYKIILDDGEFITYDNVIIENNLLFKKVISKDIYSKIIKDTNYYDIYNKCLKSILKSRKCEKDIKEYLEKFEISDTDKESIIIKLKDINMINDREYTRAYINDKLCLSKNGLNKIKLDLINKDIPYEIIEEELSNIDTNILDNRLEKLIIKKINTNHKYSNCHLKQKILNDMISLGYDKDKVLHVIENNLKSDDDIITKEFNKIYNKLSIKYSGNELLLKLKQKMLSKGFNSENINELIEKINKKEGINY